MKRYLISLAVVFTLLACGETPCSKGILHIRTIGFTEAEVDTVVLRRFARSSSVAIDSFVFDTTTLRFVRYGDTLRPGVYHESLLMQSNYDYEYFFPRVSRTFRITEISEEESSIDNGLFGEKKVACVNPINSAKVNGQLVSTSSFPNSVFLIK